MVETAKTVDLKVQVFDTLKAILKIIDSQTLKVDVIKSLEKIRQNETDPRVCLKMLEIYEEIGKILGPEEIAARILPGIIPMLVTGQFTKSEFKDLMGAVRRLLDQIEAYRMKSLPDQSQSPGLGNTDSSNPFGGSEPTNPMFAGMSGEQNQSNSDPFGGSKKDDADVMDFLGGGPKPVVTPQFDPFNSSPKDPFANPPSS